MSNSKTNALFVSITSEFYKRSGQYLGSYENNKINSKNILINNDNNCRDILYLNFFSS